MPKTRLYYLDMAKGIGIFLVILGHIEYLDPSAQRFISSFHMPLFFVVGGVLAYRKEDSREPFGEQLKRRARGTLVSYASFSIIMLTMRTFEYFVQPERITGRELAKEFVESLTGYGLYTLWFLPAYFLSGALFTLLCRRLREKQYFEWLLSLAVFLLAASAFGITAAIHAEQYPVTEETLLWYAGMDVMIVFLRMLLVLPFFWLGRWYGKLEKADEKKPLLFLSGAGLFMLGTLGAMRLPGMDLHYLYFSPLHYGTAAVSSMGILNMLRALPVSRVLSYLGQNSLIIMCTHAGMYVLYYVSLGMFFVRKFVPMTDSLLYVCITIMTCVAEVPIIYIFNRYFKHLLGKKVFE